MGINRISSKIILISSLFFLIFSIVINGCGKKEKKNIFAVETTDKKPVQEIVDRFVEALNVGKSKSSSSISLSKKISLALSYFALPTGWTGPDSEGYYNVSLNSLSSVPTNITVSSFKIRMIVNKQDMFNPTDPYALITYPMTLEIGAKIEYSTTSGITGKVTVSEKTYKTNSTSNERVDEGNIVWQVTNKDYTINFTGTYINLPVTINRSNPYTVAMSISGITSDNYKIAITLNIDGTGTGNISNSDENIVAKMTMINSTSGYYTLESENNAKQYPFSLM